MATSNLSREELKLALKEALAETLEENRELFQDIISDVLEDFLNTHVMSEASKPELRSRRGGFPLLEGKA